MTARELIEELSKLPPKAEVRMRGIDEYSGCLICSKVRMIKYENIKGRDIIDLY